MPDTRTDNELLRAFYECSAEAFAALMRRWEKQLYHFFRQMGLSHEEVEEAVQDTFMKIYLTKETISSRYDPAKPFSP